MSLGASFAARRGWFTLSLAVLVADQATKLAADRWLLGHPPVTVVPGGFNLIYSLNRGGLFGFFSGWDDPWRTVLLTAFPLAAIGLIARTLARTDDPDRGTLAGLALILGGAAGNLVDRALRGHVVDFLDVYVSHAGLAGWLEERFGTAHWPTFNLADSAIVVGAVLLLLDVARPERKSRPTADPA